jgi:hypothetical protein
MAIRGKQVVVEGVTQGPAAVRASEVFVEALVTGGLNIRAEQIVLEVLRDPSADVVGGSSYARAGIIFGW